MAFYEHVFLARQDISGQQADALAEHFKGVVEGNGGKIAKVENWGLRTAAYRIRKNRKAHYILFNVDAPAAAISELERQERIHEDVLRYLTIRVEKLDEGQSAILKKVDREERGDRGFDRGDRGFGRGDRGPRREGGEGGDREDRPRRPRPPRVETPAEGAA
jgi:small subunit ribosomal protein S6